MKIIVHIKDPDGFGDAIQEAVDSSIAKLGLTKDEADALKEKRTERVQEALSKWVEFDECTVIEFDIEAGTATVRKP